MRKMIILACAAAGLGACGQSSSNEAANQASANAAQPKKAAYCFFKDAETKDWAASRDKDGNVLVKGKVYREDTRYKAVLGEPTVTGSTAQIAPSLTTNDTGYGAPGNWWDVAATLPDSAAIDTVNVTCGAKTVASLKVPPKG